MIELRGAEPNDLAFIMSTVLRGLRFGNPYFEAMDADSYYASKKEEITAILCQPDVSVRVACDSDDREWIAGYVIAKVEDSGANIVFCWVRPTLRKQGIAGKLCEGLRVKAAANTTKIGQEIINKKGWKLCPIMINYINKEGD